MTGDDQGDWRTAANCATTDPELFYDPDKPRSWADQQRAMKDALAVCAECEVKASCLVEAVENGERFGIWGGTTERQRAPMIAEYHEGKAANLTAPEYDQTHDEPRRESSGKGWAA